MLDPLYKEYWRENLRRSLRGWGWGRTIVAIVVYIAVILVWFGAIPEETRDSLGIFVSFAVFVWLPLLLLVITPARLWIEERKQILEIEDRSPRIRAEGCLLQPRRTRKKYPGGVIPGYEYAIAVFRNVPDTPHPTKDSVAQEMIADVTFEASDGTTLCEFEGSWTKLDDKVEVHIWTDSPLRYTSLRPGERVGLYLASKHRDQPACGFNGKDLSREEYLMPQMGEFFVRADLHGVGVPARTSVRYKGSYVHDADSGLSEEYLSKLGAFASHLRLELLQDTTD